MVIRVSGALLLLFVSACATYNYQPGSLDAAAEAQGFGARSMAAPALKDYLAAHGRAPAEWPLPEWALPELTLLAFYYHPDLALARAQATAARAEAELAGRRSPFKIAALVEHHDRRGEGSDSPWSLGFDVAIPIASSGRRSAIVERAGYLAAAAELNVGSVAWQVRSRVRARLLDVYAAHSATLHREAELRTRTTLVTLLERRVAAGFDAAPELTDARIKLSEAKGRLASAATAERQARGELAAALGVAPDTLQGQPLSFAEFEVVADAPPPADLQREALTNRLDLRQALLDYAAADATVKLEVARQYPELTLRPGYSWDQGVGVWSLAAGLLLPVDSAPAIRAAEAQREVAARRALRQQADVITAVQSSLATYRQAAAGANEAALMSRTQSARAAQAQKQFEAGYLDRLELTQSLVEAGAIARNALTAQLETQRALGRLEDALQRPLAGGPVPLARAYGMAETPRQARAGQ